MAFRNLFVLLGAAAISAWGQAPLSMPVLAVGAAWGYGAASAQTIRRVASDVQDVLIERCGHYPAEERPAELATAIRDFLARPDSAPAA